MRSRGFILITKRWRRLRQLIERYRARFEVPPEGFTLLELLMVTMIIGTLSTMVAPSLQRAREQVQVAAAISEIRIVEAELLVYMEINFGPPVSLAAIQRAGLVDPWGYPYVYQPASGAGGGARKDKFMVPLNTDFDLYSVGADGESAATLSNKKSNDDVLRALNGAYVGLGSNF